MAPFPETMVPLDDVRKMKRSASSHSIEASGESGASEYQIRAVNESGRTISLWHDVSLVHIDPETQQPTPYLNFVCEIPKFTRKKFEIATSIDGNPIVQDKKNGVLREIKHGDLGFNYGCFPQTWEDPTIEHEGCRGDNDPLDVVEIGARIIRPGDVRPVKVLGILLMIDEGECDWKVVVIDAADKWAPFLNDVNDVEEQLPGQLEAIREWYRNYKVPDGKPQNRFGLDEQFMGKHYAATIIEECHHAWETLISGEKMRQVASRSDDVKDLVRNLSRNSLFTLAQNLDEHVEARTDDFGEEDSGALFF